MSHTYKANDLVRVLDASDNGMLPGSTTICLKVGDIVRLVKVEGDILVYHWRGTISTQCLWARNVNYVPEPEAGETYRVLQNDVEAHVPQTNHSNLLQRGDTIICSHVKTCDFTRQDKGLVVCVGYVIERHNDGRPLYWNHIPLRDLELWDVPRRASVSKPCTCDIVQLMREGCKCGGS